jgi:hypothetical protein
MAVAKGSGYLRGVGRIYTGLVEKSVKTCIMTYSKSVTQISGHDLWTWPLKTRGRGGGNVSIPDTAE